MCDRLNPLPALLALILCGCASTSTTTSSSGVSTSASAKVTTPAAPAPSRVVTTPSGLQIEDLVVGDGALAERGNEVLVHYTGTFTDGTKFDSSLDRRKPIAFRIGDGTMIAGWDEGVQGMRVGGKRKLIVPPSLAYGSNGRQGIPPDATLVFEIELLDLR
jgi:FKBP-type peptidyl-prolyl cis-trans isomerase